MAKRSGSGRRSRTKTALWVIGILVVLFILIQFVPYGRDHTNPPTVNAFRWSDPQAQALAKRSCYDCHSNKTTWWWATKIAPASWLTYHDVSDARAIMNFSEWSGAVSADEFSHAVTGNMPPLQYTLLHPDAKLTDAEKQTLLDGFNASLAANGGSTGGNQSGGSTPAPDATAAASSSAATAVIDASCSSCHSPDLALNYRASSAAEAQALIDQMVQQGASLTQGQEQTLIAYFTR